MTLEEKQRIAEIEKRLASYDAYYPTDPDLWPDALKQSIEAVRFLLSLVKEQEAPQMFPIQNGPAIPWDMAELAYATYSKMCGTRQSLERLAERGGFGWYEFLHLYFNDERFEQSEETLRERWKTDVLKLQWEAKTKAIHDATSMRSACVEKVRALAAAHRTMAQGLTDSMLAELQKLRAEECDSIQELLQLVSIQEQEK